MSYSAKEVLRASGKATAFAAAFFAVMAALSPTAVVAQADQTGLVRVDTLLVEGNQRIQAQVILSLFAVQPGQEITYRAVQRGVKELLETGQFRDVVVRARGQDPYVLVITVDEQPIVRRVAIEGLQNVSVREVRDTTGLNTGFPLNQQRILDAKAYIRAELASEGIPFAEIVDRVVPIPGADNEVELIIEVAEGQRVTIAQVQFIGNEGLADGDLSGAMTTKAEGFWWFRSGAFDQIDFSLDLEGNLPRLYRSRGYLDFRIVNDTVIVDPASGKARVEITVDEGVQYRLGEFSVEGNTVFTDAELEGLFRARRGGGILGTLGLGGGSALVNEVGQVFDAEAFNEAIQSVQERYRNEGYLYIRVDPVVSVVANAGGEGGTVNATWQVTEGTPAIVNRVSIVGNEYTYEWVIRNQMFILPGDVYSQDLLLRSYQNISALGFFEAPMPFPDITPLDNGDVDVTFNVVEKQTGSINFGTSVGGGIGLSGFVGYEQPNLFGQAKAGTLRWDFGRYVNSFELAYTDPALYQTRTSATISLFNSRDRFFQFSSGRRRRIGTNLRVGFPWRSARSTRVFLGYGISRTKYELFNDVDDNSLFGRPPGVQSQLSAGITRQSLDHPLFPTIGSRQNLNVEQNGGFLGGDGDFTRVLGDATWWVPVGRLGGSDTGGGVRFALGLTLKGGAVFGDAEAFPFDRFWMGGVQFGQNLRGYDETSVTPLGYFAERSADITDIDRLGDAFFTLTAEYAIRLNDQIGMGLFYDAGSVWRDPGEFDPTSLFRGAGFGVQVVTPFGPIGLDYAYGFDRDVPGWQLHFRMGPGF
ncbi:MAG: outer membrane protein assembly factor BamA [Gemmatimonadetes bacterium]|nr:outer membrane protein assembly factor BamA [Gemmatimonadota bacterium]MDA1104350.1 outer membrane protein assembly factor BamA [Gemmatimonadota bacterium]